MGEIKELLKMLVRQNEVNEQKSPAPPMRFALK